MELLKLRRLLEEHGLGRLLFDALNSFVKREGMPYRACMGDGRDSRERRSVMRMKRNYIKAEVSREIICCVYQK